MKHYICKGGCGGVSDNEGACQASDCPDLGKSLQECDCIDGYHEDNEGDLPSEE